MGYRNFIPAIFFISVFAVGCKNTSFTGEIKSSRESGSNISLPKQTITLPESPSEPISINNSQYDGVKLSDSTKVSIYDVMEQYKKVKK